MKNFKSKVALVLILFALVLFSGCKAKEFKLSFEVNGGSAVETQTLTKDEEFELPSPTKEGYSFAGWYLNADFTGDSITKVTLTEDLKLYAKWDQLYAVTLDLDGGTCDKTIIYGSVGDSVLNLLSNVTPTKSGVTFGGWFVNNSEITANTKLTAKGITVKAKYKAEYVINVYKEKVTKDGYDKEEVKQKEFVGSTISNDLDFEGFTLVEKEDSVDSLTISSNKAENVMNVYYDRDEYTVTFRSNFPVEGMEAITNTVKVVYGEKKEVPVFDYTCEGYYLLGWSETENGSVKYDAHYLDNLAVNGQETEVKYDELNVSRNTSLYAVWNKGYRDMFGGNDYVFLTDNEAEIYLCRGGVYFVGKYVSENKTFLFKQETENLQGVIYEDGTFAYYNSSRDEYSAVLYKIGSGLVDDVKIYFDAYNGITYANRQEDGTTKNSEGTYTINENGYYVATFTEGELSGKTLTLIIGQVTIDNVKTNAFQLRNDEEVELGLLVRFVVNNGQMTYYTGAYQMMLSGFGTLLYNTGTSTTTYYYTVDSESNTLTLMNSNGQSAGLVKLMEINGKNGYMPYDEATDLTFENEDGSKLVIDGICNATYTDALGNEVSGYYTISTSVFGGYIVKVTDGSNTYTFLTKTTKTEQLVEGSETEKETVTKYTFTEKLATYQEYYYQDANGTYYAPMMVIDDVEEGKASVYGYTQSRTYELILTGSYTYDENTKTYNFVTETVEEKEVLTSPLDISKVKEVTFVLDTTSTNYKINYWKSYTDVEDVVSNYGVDYTSEDGATLTLIAGIAIYSKDGLVASGTFKTSGAVTTITTRNGNVYLEIDEESKTFITLKHSPYNAYVVQENGQYSSSIYVAFDGKGNAVYNYTEQEEVEGENKTVKKTISGTIEELSETTKQGNKVYQFNSSELTIKYITISTQNGTFVFPEYGKYKGNYTSNDGILYLDGFGYYATYTDSEGVEVGGIYSSVEENVIRITTQTNYRYFDINSSSFTARGVEYGTYVLMDNQGIPGKYITLDGYGKAEIYKMEKDTNDEYQKVFETEQATYVIDGELFTITYTKGIEEISYVGYLGTYTYGTSTYNTFIIEHKEAVQTFVNVSNWTVLKLDSKGQAVLIDSNGIKVNGTYMLITDSLLYFVNEASTNANIFTYNKTTGRIVEAEFTPRGYYTNELNGLLFSEYGFAIFNNETRYYYTMEGNDVIIYHQDAQDPNANEYGFVKEVFGPFDDVKEYNGKTYYAKPGYAITFSRVEETKDKYPVNAGDSKKPLEKLTFAPSGSDEFSVSGSVFVNGTNYPCTVERVLEDGVYNMYIYNGSLRIGITCTYAGENNCSYEVISLTSVNVYYPYQYLNNYYMIYMFYGSQYASTYTNNYGMIRQFVVFGEDGEETDRYVVAELLDGSNAYDMNGELLKAEHSLFKEVGRYYSLELESTDGYTYKLYIELTRHQAFSSLVAYKIYGVVRSETMTSGDYELTVERIIATESSYPPGTIFTMNLKKGEDELESSIIYKLEDTWYYVVRNTDEEGNHLSTKYYKLDLVEKDASSVEGEENEVCPYESATVTEIEVSTYFTADKKTYADVMDGKVVLIQIGSTRYVPTETTYDEESKTYTITLSNKKKYNVVVGEENTITVTLVVEEGE